LLRTFILVGMLAVTTALNSLSNAQAQTAASSNNCPYWIDAATGERARTVPIGVNREELYELQIGLHPNHAHGASGRNYVKQPDGTWIDAATGERARTVPIGVNREELYELQIGLHPNYAHGASGRNYVLIPCPPPTTQTSWTGGYFGGEIIKNGARVKTTERSAATGAITNQFDDDGDPIGGGFVAGWNFAPWNSNIVVGPFASIDWLHQTINHNFAGGQFLGTTTHWIVTTGAKAGVVTMPGVYLYGLAGASWLNQDLNVNFATAASSNVTTPGFTLGLGGEFQPQWLQQFGRPVSLFAQYQHTWYGNANFNTPASSPGSNYAFRRDDDTFKFGVNIYFNAPPPAAPPPIIRK